MEDLGGIKMKDQNEEVTPKQRKEISKILFKRKASLFFMGLQASVSFFAANMICFVLGNWYLKDVDPSMISGFDIVTTSINFIFVILFLDGQLKHYDDMYKKKIVEVLKKK
jgi:hypothetical protein